MKASVKRTLHTFDRGRVVQTATKYLIYADGHDLDTFCRIAAAQAKMLGDAPFEVVEKPEGTPNHAVIYLLNDVSSATIPPEFWQ